jgi:hypothetical protein
MSTDNVVVIVRFLIDEPGRVSVYTGDFIEEVIEKKFNTTDWVSNCMGFEFKKD